MTQSIAYDKLLSIICDCLDNVRSHNGSLVDCCTEVNYLIRSAILALDGEILSIRSVDRIVGDVVFSGEYGRHYECNYHEWISFEGINIDPTAEQFGLTRYDESTHFGSIEPW